MEYRDYEELGKKIQDLVDHAIDENNYRKLSETIGQVVEKAQQTYSNYRTDGSSWDYREHRSWEFKKDSGKENTQRRTSGKAVYEQSKTESKPVLYGETSHEKIKGILQVVFGGLLTGTMGTVFLVSLVLIEIGLFSAAGFGGILCGICGVSTVAAGILLGSGCRKLSRLKRLKKYIEVLGDKTYCDFKRLSQAIGRNVKFVKKDVQVMLEKGWFLEGHVDKQETCLITSDETYRQYITTQSQLEERQLQASRMQQEKKEEPQLSKEVQLVVDRGNEFLRQIRECNDAIPGEEISEKMYYMEKIVGKIFERAKEDPKIIPDLNRLMDYYLPMTVKLLKAYEDMDEQPVQGETIAASKKEIEETIDTLNVAFEKLLDSIFEDTAMDVSSDISVLHTVLAQEGLTEDELSKLKREAEKLR